MTVALCAVKGSVPMGRETASRGSRSRFGFGHLDHTALQCGFPRILPSI